MSDDLVAWLREQINARKTTARQALGDQGAGRSIRVINGALAIMPSAASDFLSLHLASCGPRDTIARCEAELAILGEHYILRQDDTSEAYEEFSVTPHPGALGCDFGCVTCHYRGMGGVWGKGYCRTVRLLASGYSSRPGYRAEEWKP